jgi:Ser/Thr protein kinase RdoA (MazF antagonist)
VTAVPSPPPAVLARHGLAPAGPAAPLPDGAVSRAWLLPAGGGLVVARQYAARFGPARARLAAAVHQHAARAGLAPALLPARDGGLVTTAGDGRAWIVMRHAPGTSAGPATLAAALGALHEALADFTPADGEDCPDFVSVSVPPRARLEQLLGDPAHEHSAGLIARRLEVLRAAEPGAAGLLAGDRTWIHGDARPANLLAVPGGGRGLFIDFDQASRFPRAYEVLRAFFAAAPPLDHGGLRGALRAFLAAYDRSGTPLGSAERAGMASLYVAVQAAETRTFTSVGGEVRGMAAYAAARHRHLEWLAAHRGQLDATIQEDT